MGKKRLQPTSGGRGRGGLGSMGPAARGGASRRPPDTREDS